MSALDDLHVRQDAAVENGMCGCLCGRALPTSRRKNTRHLPDHRRRAHRARVGAAAKDAGLSAAHGVLTLGGLDRTGRTGKRPGDAPATRKPRQAARREGVTVYLPSVKVAKAARAALTGVPEARDAVSKALTRRRAREEREASRAA